MRKPWQVCGCMLGHTHLVFFFRLTVTVAKGQELLISLLKVLVELRILFFQELEVCLMPLGLHFQICTLLWNSEPYGSWRST